MGETSILNDTASRQMEDRSLTKRLLRHQNIGDSEEPVMLAQDLIGAGRLRDARLVCMTALHKDPCDVDLLLTGAGVAENLGELIDARTLLVKAARLVPEWVEPMYRLSRLLFRMEDFGRAWAAIERCYSMDPTNALTCALRADIEQAHRLTLRMERFVRNEHADDAAMLANALVADGRFDDALVVLDHALERDGDDADALFVKATILKARGEREKAQAALRRVTQMECGWVEAWETMADLLEELGDRDHAERLRAHAATIEVDPLMLVDMAVIAGASETAFADLTMSEDLDRAVAAGVSAMSDLKRSLVGNVHAPVLSAADRVEDLSRAADPGMLIRDAHTRFTPTSEPADFAEFSPEAVEAASIPALQFLVENEDEVEETAHANPPRMPDGNGTWPLGTYAPTKPAATKPAATKPAATKPAAFAPVPQPPAPRVEASPQPKSNTSNGEFTAPPSHTDSSRSMAAPNRGATKPLSTYAEAMAHRNVPVPPPIDEAAILRGQVLQSEDEGMVLPLLGPEELVTEAIAIKARCTPAAPLCVDEVEGASSMDAEPLEAEPVVKLAPQAIKPAASTPITSLPVSPVTVQRIIDVRPRRDEVHIFKAGGDSAVPVSELVGDADADLDELLADDSLFPAEMSEGTIEAHTEEPVDADSFPIDAEAESFPSVDAEAEAFPSIDIDVGGLVDTPAPSPTASIRYQMFAYLTGREFERVGAGSHHVGFVATDSFKSQRLALRIRDGKVTLEDASLPPAETSPVQSTSAVDSFMVTEDVSEENTGPIEEVVECEVAEAGEVVECEVAEAGEVAEAEVAEAEVAAETPALEAEAATLPLDKAIAEILAKEPVEASAETLAHLDDLLSTQASLEFSPESREAFDTLLALEADPFDALANEDDADTLLGAPLFDDAGAAVEEVSEPIAIAPDAEVAALEPAAKVDVKEEAEPDAEAQAIPLAVRKERKKPRLRARPAAPEEELGDLRSQILAAAGINAEALEAAVQATRLPSALVKAEEELDEFLEEVVKRPRLRMRTTKGRPYRPPSPRELFPKHVEVEGEDEDGADLSA